MFCARRKINEILLLEKLRELWKNGQGCWNCVLWSGLKSNLTFESKFDWDPAKHATQFGAFTAFPMTNFNLKQLRTNVVTWKRLWTVIAQTAFYPNVKLHYPNNPRRSDRTSRNDLLSSAFKHKIERNSHNCLQFCRFYTFLCFYVQVSDKNCE
jgi:hypothetical protein